MNKVSAKIIARRRVFPMFVKPIKRSLDRRRSNFNDYPAHEFPRMIALSKLENYNNEVSLLYYFDSKGSQRYAYVPNNFMFAFCTKKEKQKLKINYDKHIVDNFPHLRRSYHIGSDPEIFIEDKQGKLIPAFEFLPGKDKPVHYSSRDSGDLGIYWDGFQAEFTTHANTCLAFHVDSIQVGLKTLLKKAQEYNKNAKLSTKTCMTISPELRESTKEEHVQFGCMPSLNIYGMKGLQVDGRELPYRSSGGHIHFGFGEKTPKQIELIVKALDAIVGVACVAMFAKYDDPKRRKCYGLAGEYRLPKHGLEYRVLSNAWIFHPIIMNMVFDLAGSSARIGELGLLKYWKGNEKETIDCINNCDVKTARAILKRNKDMFIGILKRTYTLNPKHYELVFKVFYNGMDSIVRDTSNFEKNWNINKGQWLEHSNGEGKNVSGGIRLVASRKKVA